MPFLYGAHASYSLCCQRVLFVFFFFFSSRRRHTRFDCDWSSDVCSSDLPFAPRPLRRTPFHVRATTFFRSTTPPDGKRKLCAKASATGSSNRRTSAGEDRKSVV